MEDKPTALEDIDKLDRHLTRIISNCMVELFCSKKFVHFGVSYGNRYIFYSWSSEASDILSIFYEVCLTVKLSLQIDGGRQYSIIRFHAFETWFQSLS